MIFDGGGLVFQNGRLLLDAPRFREGWASAVVDLDRTSRLRMENTTWRTDCEDFPAAAARRAGDHLSRTNGGSLASRVPGARRAAAFSCPPRQSVHVDPRDVALDDLFEALAHGVKSYFEKTGAFRSLGIALSGGRDSMLTLLVAWRAAQLITGTDAGRASRAGGAGGTLITAFYMPSRHSQETTKTAAHTLAEELGVELRTIPIDDATDRESSRRRARC